MDNHTINSTINVLLQVIDEDKFLEIVDALGLDAYTKKLLTSKFLQLFIVAQLEELSSLKETAKYLKDSEELQVFLNLESIHDSQLSRKQNFLPPKLFEGVFQELVHEIQVQSLLKKQQPIIREINQLRVIDSSTMTMSINQFPWATFRQTKAGIRLHLKVVVTEDMIIPEKGTLLPARHADRTQMEELIEYDENTIYLFDRGYNDYAQYDRLCEEEIPFVTRLKKNAKIEVLSEQAADLDNHIFLDQEVFLGNELNGTKMKSPLRLIKTRDSEGNEVVILTNCFDLLAKEICDLYRYRWKIETFFKWIKQHLRMKTFFGKSQNAVYN